MSNLEVMNGPTSNVKPVPITTAAATPTVADQIYALIHKHCVITDHEKVAITLWLMSSWVFDAFRIFPRLALISPEKRCGKSTLMEVIDAVAFESLMVANATTAVLSRIAELGQPTLMLDEADTFVKGGDPTLIGLINSGHSKATAKVLKCQGENFEPKVFSTWMPVVLASIGLLSDTIMDRSIQINLRRKKPSEKVERIPEGLKAQCELLRKEITAWQKQHMASLTSNTVTPPAIDNDRAMDNWLPLFTVAKTINPTWEKLCEDSYKAITKPAVKELQTQLLEDIKEAFSNISETRIPSRVLVDSLRSDPDKPWEAYNRGLTAASMAQLLMPYDIAPKMMRIGGESPRRGYDLADFKDAFERYLP